jgi:hypothetical protein
MGSSSFQVLVGAGHCSMAGKELAKSKNASGNNPHLKIEELPVTLDLDLERIFTAFCDA